jgi:Zn-dependent protease with chaperone function
VQGVILLAMALFTAALTFCLNWLALIPWRRVRAGHWTERARLLFPVRVAAVSNLTVLPLIGGTAAAVWPDDLPHWSLAALAAAIGAIAGTIPVDREVFPRIGFARIVREVIITWIIRFSKWAIFISAAALMPESFNATSAMIFAAVILLLIFWSRSGWIWASRRLGYFAPAPERLKQIVYSTSARMAVPVRESYVIHSSFAQAYALPGTGRLLFTERILELLTDEELAAVCSHELGHLMESRGTYLKRHVLWLTFLPWLFVRPAFHTFGIGAVGLMWLCTLLIPRVYRSISHQLELRADTVAHHHENDPGTYARALSRLHEDNLIPAVHSRDHSTHPHLYDRMIAAGVTPDFARPEPARRMDWHGYLVLIILGLLVSALLIRLIE